MHALKMVMLLVILFIASARGFPTFETEIDYQRSLELGMIRRFARGIGFLPSTEEMPTSIMTVENPSTPKLTKENTAPPGVVKVMSSKTEPALRPIRTKTELPLTIGERIETESSVPRNRRALSFRSPGLRIPIRARPQVSIPRSPGAGSRPAPFPKGGPKLGAGLPPASPPTGGFAPGPSSARRPPGSTAKGKSKSGPSGAGASPQANDKSRRKWGSKGSESLPDIDDLPSLGDWSDDFGGSSASGNDSEKPKEEEITNKTTTTANKDTTTERNLHKWDRPHFHQDGPPPHFHHKGPPPHFHHEGPGDFPDYGWHGW